MNTGLQCLLSPLQLNATIAILVDYITFLNIFNMNYSGRYGDFAKQLNANGYKVFGMDWIGKF